MNAVVLYGTEKHGTTRRLTEGFLKELRADRVTEFVFPRDLPHPCTGCIRCVVEGETGCPHREPMLPILAALQEADVIVAASPVYVMGMTGALKAFFDHLAYRWLVHRPDPAMCRKVAVGIATAAGPCTGKLLRDLKQQFFFWGVPRTYTWGEAVGGGWDCMKPEQRAGLERKAVQLAARVRRSTGQVRPTLKLRAVFSGMAFMQKHNLSPTTVEHDYWVEQGWTRGGRPWK